MDRIDIVLINKIYKTNKDDIINLKLNLKETIILNEFKQKSIITKEYLCKTLYDEDYDISFNQSINIFIHRFRKKISPYYNIKTIYKGGYILEYNKRKNN